MFERYTEKARRSIFFARYEASQFGSPVIETEHLLLGVLREDARMVKLLPAGAVQSIRTQIEARTKVREKMSTSVDLPLSNPSKRVLAYGAEEAERMKHRHIGTEHLFLGLFREKGGFAAEILESFGVELEQLREKISAMPVEISPGRLSSLLGRTRIPPESTIEIHGSRRNADYVRDVVSTIRSCNWHWHKTEWKSRDVVINRNNGKFSFELSLAADSENFTLIQNGWKKDHCFLCGWELFESSDEHGSGCTNGRNWLCTECYERFLQRDFFSSSHPEIT